MKEECVLSFFKVDIFAHEGLDVLSYWDFREALSLAVFLSSDVGEKTENRPSEHLGVFGRDSSKGAVLGFNRAF